MTATPIGSEFRVDNNEPGVYLRQNADVATDADGDFVVVWQSESGSSSVNLLGQRYNSSGVPQGATFQVNSTPASSLRDQHEPSVAMDPAGNFVVTWTVGTAVGHESSDNQAYHDRFIRGRRFAADGTPLGLDFTVSTNDLGTVVYNGPDGPKFESEVAVSDSGAFVVVWSAEHDGFSDVLVQRFAADGTKLGGETNISGTMDYGGQSTLSMDAAGNYVVAWFNSTNILKARLFNADGTDRRSTFNVGESAYSGSAPSIAMSASGDFVAVWMGGFDTIKSQLYSSMGVAQGVVFNVNSPGASSQSAAFPKVVRRDSGEFVVAWHTQNGVYARAYTSSGVALYQDFLVTPLYVGYTIDMAIDDNGNFVISYVGSSSTFHSRVFARRYSW